ncbi:MAG: 50S ribosomal protein L37ae [Candidatus Aenigmarchaeota archaeon]|nr:50S ribosomal protein L37ae [Candidatus Aenigmarchaeota archaeon]
MTSKKKQTVGRYGPRYGRRTKKIIAAIEEKQKQKQICPYCERHTLKRVCAGIWKCKKCGVKFAGGAYFPRSNIAKGE